MAHAARPPRTGHGGSTVVTPPSPTPVARVASSAPPTSRSSTGSESATPRIRASSTVVDRVVNSPAVSRTWPSLADEQEVPPLDDVAGRPRSAPRSPGRRPARRTTTRASAKWATHSHVCSRLSRFTNGRSSPNWESTPIGRRRRTTSRDRLNGANRSQDQSIAGQHLGGLAAARRRRGPAARSPRRASTGIVAAARRASSTRRAARRPAVADSESRVIRVSSTPVPICDLGQPERAGAAGTPRGRRCGPGRAAR